MNTNTPALRRPVVPVVNGRVRQPAAGVRRLIRRLERERRTWVRHLTHDGPMVATEVAWRAGVAEGLRLAQTAIRRGV